MATKYDELIEKLERRLDESDGPPFQPDEVKTLRLMIKAYEMFLSWGKLGKVVIWVIITAAAAWTALNSLGIGVGK